MGGGRMETPPPPAASEIRLKTKYICEDLLWKWTCLSEIFICTGKRILIE